MARNSSQGQVLIETLMLTLFLAGFYWVSFEPRSVTHNFQFKKPIQTGVRAMRDLKILIHDLISEKKWRNYFFLFLLAPLISFLVFEGKSDQTETKKESLNPVAIDTLIPSGFTLFPIEISNLDSINSFVGQFAVTDVYTVTLTHALASQLVAQNVKLLRSQVNSQQLALLIPAYAVGHFMKYPQPYALVIHQQSQDLEFKLPAILSSKNQTPEITYFE